MVTDPGRIGREGIGDAVVLCDDFAERVMQRIRALPAPAPSRQRAGWLAWFALAAGALLGAAQLAGFMFGIWTAATAG